MNTREKSQRCNSNSHSENFTKECSDTSTSTCHPLPPLPWDVDMQIKPSDKVVDDYDFLQIIGQGAFGTVFKAICKKSNQVVAIKYLKGTSQAFREAGFMSKIPKHPHIIKMLQIYLSDEAIFLVQEFYPQTLADIQPLLTPRDTLSIIYQLASVLEFLHGQSIIHRDLKPENILVSREGQNWSIRLIDFGLATFDADKLINCRPAGTDLYMAPEMIRGSYGCQADIWSLGIISAYLMCGKLPFPGSPEPRRLYEQILGLDSRTITFPPGFEIEICSIVRSLLEQDPEKRLKGSQIRTKLSNMVN
jgi:calcium-dependent protein kinase